MRYRIFLYGTTAKRNIGLYESNLAVSQNGEKHWRSEAKQFREFDTEQVRRSLEAALTDPVTGMCKCTVRVQYPPRGYPQIGYLYLATSYEKAAEVLPTAYAIAAEQDLVLYDAERERRFYRELVDLQFLTDKLRRQALLRIIRQEMQPIWRIRSLESVCTPWQRLTSYAVTLRRDRQVSFAERNRQFYACLQKSLDPGENLLCEDQCYSVVGEGYCIRFVLEGYKKHADRFGYVEGETACVAPLHRMGTDEACAWAEGCTEAERSDIQKRMQFLEMKDKYPNPGQRFVESVKITKWQRKQVFGIRYSGSGYYGSEIAFYAVVDSLYDNRAELSVLKIEEESASYILPFVAKVYPELYDGYYGSNQITARQMEQIIQWLKAAKEVVLHDTYSPELTSLLKSFNLYVLLDDADPREWDFHNPKGRVEFLFAHRYEVAGLYDTFIRWAEAQLNTHCYDSELKFNIQGP